MAVMLKILILWTLLLVTTFSWAENPQEQFNQQFHSSRIQFLKEDSPYLEGPAGRYSPILRFLFEKVLAWIPTGKPKPMEPGCEVEAWAARLQDPRIRKSAALQGAVIQKYFKDCQTSLIETDYHFPGNTLSMMTMKLAPTKHPFLRPVLFHLPGNVKLKGLLGLKGDFKKRPLVVMRVGVFSNTAEFFPERAWMMMFFEQTSFNVLLVENMTGSDFIANNTTFAFGGYDEGLQNIMLAQLLRDPAEPLSQLVESLHLFGVSLGGHGTLFASLLNEVNSPKGKPLYQSFFGMCPVVDLKASMVALTHNKPFTYSADFWAQQRLKGLREKIPSINEHPAFSFLETAVGEVVRTYKGGLSYTSGVRLPEGMEDVPDFWKVNNYWPYYRDVRQPVLVWATHEDPIVPYALNAKTLQTTLKLPNSNIGVVDFQKGVHCTLPVAYNWKALTSLFQSYILSHSPGFQQQIQELRLDLQDEVPTSSLSETSKITFEVLPLKPESKFVQLEIQIQTSEAQNHSLKMNLPLAQFDYRFLNSKLSPSEEWMIQRWIYQNLSMKLTSLEGTWSLVAQWPVAK